MLDQIFSWLVLVIPVFLGLVVILVPAKHEDEKGHMRWRHILGALLILYGGLAWVEQSRTSSVSSKDRQEAIEDTAAKTSAKVSKTVGDQYQQMVSDLTMQIQSLREQLADQLNKQTIQMTAIFHAMSTSDTGEDSALKEGTLLLSKDILYSALDEEKTNPRTIAGKIKSDTRIYGCAKPEG